MAKVIKDITEVYNSLSEFKQAISSRETNEAFKYSTLASQSTARTKDYYGTPNFEEADNLLLTGDKDNLKKIEKQAVKLHNTTNYNANKTKIARSVAGGRPSIPTYLAGAPNCMMSAKRAQIKSRVINILFNAAVSDGNSVDKVAKASAKIASIINSYEQANVRCNLYISCNTESWKGQKLNLFIKLKDAGAPLNRLNIAYPMINPSMLRRHILRWVETTPEVHNSFCNSYGHPINVDAKSDVVRKVFHNAPCEVYNLQDMM